MKEMLGILGEIVVTPGVPFRFGVLISSAIVIGFVLMNNDRRQLIRWFFSGIVFLILNEWVRIALISSAGVACDTCNAPSLFTLVAGVCYGAGIIGGVSIANRTRHTPDNLEKLTRDLITSLGKKKTSAEREKSQPVKEVMNER